MKRLALVAISIGCGSHPPAPAPAPHAEAAPPTETAAQPAPAPVAQAPAPAVGHPKNDLIPRSVLFGNPERANVQISPDGKHLSWVAARDGVLNVFVAPIGKLDQAKPITADKT